MCSCLIASQAILTYIAGQFGILSALFFLLGLICAFGYRYGVSLFQLIYPHLKIKSDRSVKDA